MQPLKPDNWPDELDEIRMFFGKPLNIHGMMAHHPELLQVWMPLRNHIVANSSLSDRQRELIILRTAHNCQADYEWQHHVERGLLAGLKMDEINRVKEGANAPGWHADETALLNAADDCHRQTSLSDKTLEQVQANFNSRQQLDILVTVGMYKTLATIIKTWDVPMEDN
jgi:4-carboxymuconolactone decarboxylase